MSNYVVLETEEGNRALLRALSRALSNNPGKEDEEEIEYALKLYRSLVCKDRYIYLDLHFYNK